MNRNGQIVAPLIGIVSVIVLIFLFTTFRWINVRPTDVAVEVDKVAGKVKENPKGVGYHFYNGWFTDMVTYRVAAQAYPGDTEGNENGKQYNMDVKTNDGQNVSVDLTVIYSLKAAEVPLLHQQVGTVYEDQILLPQIRSECRLAIGSYSAEDIYQGKVRDVIQQTIKDKLSKSLAKYPAIMIQDALIRHFQFSPQFEQAIEQKKLAAQQVEVNKNRALAQEEESKRIEAEARGGKLQAIQEAEGRAQSAKIEADAARYKLEQEAAGQLAGFKAQAEGRKLSADAVGGGDNYVALRFAETIPQHFQIWGIPVGQNNTSLMDVSGVFSKMFQKGQ